MRGASAIQKLLDSRPELDARVLVVWEPVIATDIAPPTTGMLARIHDARAAQYWDPDRLLSTHIVRSVLAGPERYRFAGDVYEDSIVWDTVMLFPPEVRWDDVFPVPSFHGYPVVDAIDGLSSALGKPAGSGPSTP